MFSQRAFDALQTLDEKIAYAQKASGSGFLLGGGTKWLSTLQSLQLQKLQETAPESPEDVAKKYLLNNPGAVSSLAGRKQTLLGMKKTGFQSTGGGLFSMTQKTLLGG